MSQTIASPTAPTTLRRIVARLWGDPDSRSTTIGLVAVILFHLLLWLLGPRILSFDHGMTPVRPHTTSREFNIEFAPDTFQKQPVKPKDPFKFVETNPDAPDNTPDKTN